MSSLELGMPCYSEEDYRRLRKIRRSLVKDNPSMVFLGKEWFTEHYIVKINGKKFYMSHWVSGVRVIRNHYKEDLAKYPSFSFIWSNCIVLPSSLEVFRFSDNRDEGRTQIDYVSSRLRFSVIELDGKTEYTVYHGTREEAENKYYEI